MSSQSIPPVLSACPMPGFVPNLPATGTTNRIVALLLSWDIRHRTRCHLATLPDHMLADIGLTRDDARLEASKPAWRP